jgi:hypothetical protein
MGPAPLFRGLPDDRCQACHWGLVLAGRVAFRIGDREEVYETGDAYYVARGTPLLFAGTEIVEFTPTDELERTLEAVARNLEHAWSGQPYTGGRGVVRLGDEDTGGEYLAVEERTGPGGADAAEHLHAAITERLTAEALEAD